MRILFLTQVLPYPLDAGPKTRAYYVLRYLAQQHEVTLVSFVRATDTPAALDHLRQYCAAVHTIPMPRSRVKDVGFLLESLVTGQPFIIARDRVDAMQKLLSDLVTAGEQPFDVVHADQLWMAPYAQFVQSRRSAPLVRAVLDQHNAVYMIFQRLAESERNPVKRALAQLEAHKLAAYERRVCAEFDRVAWVTQEDYDFVAQGASPAVRNDGVIPICVDTASTPPLKRNPAGKRVTFLGGLHYPPNAQGLCWFAEHIFPRILAECPDAVLTAIGKQPPAALNTYGIPEANLEVTGYVEDPLPYLVDSSVFIVPLLAGGGMRVKILDAWRWGLPMVSTTVGAEGIRYRDGENILIADAPDEFAARVLQLLKDANLNRTVGEAGRRWVEQAYDWRTVYRAWDPIYAPA
ncbi:MAG: glycosyltransferase [Anaerolineales bacterium]|nr:glycosyltransferase [Anaerolineales bacterium]